MRSEYSNAPANHIFLVESNHVDLWSDALTDFWPLQNGIETWKNPPCAEGAYSAGNCSQVKKRHSDGFNIVFADGHSKWHKKTLRAQWDRKGS